MNKKKMYKMGAILMLIALAGSLLAACQNTPVPPTPTVAPTPTKTSDLIIAVDSGNAPFMYEKDNQAAGLYPLLIQDAFKRMSVAATVEAYPWKRALAMGESGEVGIGGIYKTETRLKIYDYSAPLFSEKLLIYVKKGNGFEFNSVNDLEGRTLGVMSGWSYGDTFDQAKAQGLFKVQEVSTDAANFEKLLLGRVDGVVAIELTAQQLISEKQL
jgi:polar amino acid transport system substrate-binding protein